MKYYIFKKSNARTIVRAILINKVLTTLHVLKLDYARSETLKRVLRSLIGTRIHL